MLNSLYFYYHLKLNGGQVSNSIDIRQKIDGYLDEYRFKSKSSAVLYWHEYC